MILKCPFLPRTIFKNPNHDRSSIYLYYIYYLFPLSPNSYFHTSQHKNIKLATSEIIKGTMSSLQQTSLFTKNTRKNSESHAPSVDSAIDLHRDGSETASIPESRDSASFFSDGKSKDGEETAKEGGFVNLEYGDGDANTTRGKIITLLSLLRKFIGVKELSALRISLPTQLLEPVGNLEYWNYNDRPDYFITIPDSDDPLERMLATIRWWYSKDLKFVYGKVCKAYNSVLGEQFFCQWEAIPPEFHEDGTINKQTNSLVDDTKLENAKKTYKVTCLNEQISHHPPVSAFYYVCKEKGIEAKGIDQMHARFTGTAVKIGPGDQNKGIFVNLQTRDNEEYHLTHPWASINGWLKANLYITVSENCIITCPKTGLKAILEYKEESFFGRPRFAVEGKIFSYDPLSSIQIDKLKHVPAGDVRATITGSWRGRIFASRNDASVKTMRELVNLESIIPFQKIVKPLEDQHPMESRRIWEKVTTAIKEKDFSSATKHKIAIEDAQRRLAAERKEKGEEFVPMYFELPVNEGKPAVKENGWKLLTNGF